MQKGADIYEKIRYCMSYNEVSNTNIKAVFNLMNNQMHWKRATS